MCGPRAMCMASPYGICQPQLEIPAGPRYLCLQVVGFQRYEGQVEGVGANLLPRSGVPFTPRCGPASARDPVARACHPGSRHSRSAPSFATATLPLWNCRCLPARHRRGRTHGPFPAPTARVVGRGPVTPQLPASRVLSVPSSGVSTSSPMARHGEPLRHLPTSTGNSCRPATVGGAHARPADRRRPHDRRRARHGEPVWVIGRVASVEGGCPADPAPSVLRHDCYAVVHWLMTRRAHYGDNETVPARIGFGANAVVTAPGRRLVTG